MHNQTILLLFHESATEREISSYRIWHCAQVWQSLGFTVLIQRGCERGTKCDLVIPQIDLSVLPEEYRRLLAAEKQVVNRGVVDIRKSAFSRNLVTEDDAYDGPVIFFLILTSTPFFPQNRMSLVVFLRMALWSWRSSAPNRKAAFISCGVTPFWAARVWR